MHEQLKGGDLMKVINYDKNGNLIPDLSKKVMPLDVSRVFVQMLYEAEMKKRKCLKSVKQGKQDRP